jgi:hypothetical protein
MNWQTRSINQVAQFDGYAASALTHFSDLDLQPALHNRYQQFTPLLREVSPAAKPPHGVCRSLPVVDVSMSYRCTGRQWQNRLALS